MKNLVAAVLVVLCTWAVIASEDRVSVVGEQSFDEIMLPEDSCSPNPCFDACSGQIQNPYCTIFHATCTPGANGGVTCSCQFFCARTEGHINHWPGERGPTWLEQTDDLLGNTGGV